MYERLHDINGDAIVYPAEYDGAVLAINKLIDAMEEKKIDRSDMYVVLARVQSEAMFHLTFLPKHK